MKNVNVVFAAVELMLVVTNSTLQYLYVYQYNEYVYQYDCTMSKQQLLFVVTLTISENGETALDSNAVTKELLEEQSIHLLTRDYIELIGCYHSFIVIMLLPLHGCVKVTYL